jgi:hypothetical protein
MRFISQTNQILSRAKFYAELTNILVEKAATLTRENEEILPIKLFIKSRTSYSLILKSKVQEFQIIRKPSMFPCKNISPQMIRFYTCLETCLEHSEKIATCDRQNHAIKRQMTTLYVGHYAVSQRRCE